MSKEDRCIVGKEYHRSSAVLNSPKPFSLNPLTHRIKSVHFASRQNEDKYKAVRDGGMVDSKPVVNIGPNKVKIDSVTASQVKEQKCGVQSVELVHEPVVQPFVRHSLIKPVERRHPDSSDEGYESLAELANFLSSINFGTNPNRLDDCLYTDDDIEQVLESEELYRSDNAKLNETDSSKVSYKPHKKEHIDKVASHIGKIFPTSTNNTINSITFLVEKPGDEDFVCPPLPPPPTEEDLASYSVQSPTTSIKAESPPPPNTLISPSYKASTNFSVWTPSSNGKTNGATTEVKTEPLKTAPAGFRKVSRPTSKKGDQGPVKSTTTTRYTIPDKALPQPSDNVAVTDKNDLPVGAVYETHTIEGNMLHTDTYYPAPGEKTVLERTKKTTIIRAEHHHGIGPTDEQGLPVALRSTVENPKAWYKNMFKQIHKFDNEGDEQKNNASESYYDAQDERPIVSQSPTYKPKRLGRITDYTPSDPYVVENKPQVENKIPPASTSYKSPYKQGQPEKKSHDEPVHGTDYSLKDNFTMADHVVMEPKHVVTIYPVKPKKDDEKSPKKRQPAKAKFNFVAQSDKQLTLMKDQVVIITRDINKDWCEGETPDGKHSGIFPVAYVELLNQSATKPARRGRAQVKFDFNSTDSKQLSVKKGDSIELVEKVDKNWYKGRVGQRTGLLPANYLEVEREPEEKSSKAAGSNQMNTSRPTVVNTKNQNSTSHVHKATASSSSSNSEPDDKQKMSKASFLANAVVNSGSHLAKRHERRGEFNIPELDDDAMGISRETNGKHTPQGSYDTTISTNSSSLQSDFGQNLRISKPVNLLSSESSHSSSPSQIDKPLPFEHKDVAENLDDGFPIREKHVALYPYVPQNEDELELNGGDTVQVVEKCDDGWFVGTCERTGAFGTFPGNYVIAVD